jgi:hypothetical protein
MDPKPIIGDKVYFYCFEKKKYFKMIDAIIITDNNNNIMFFEIKAKECILKHTEDRVVPKDDHSKELKTVSFFDLIPIGNKKKYKYSVHANELKDNYIIKDKI